MNPVGSTLGMHPLVQRLDEPKNTGLLQSADEQDPEELRAAFNKFVGETFFGQLFGAMRKTVGKPAYFHGGRAEEVFQGQLDQMLSQHMAEASADSIADPMFELFQMGRMS